MSEEKLYKKLGTVTPKELERDFNLIYEKYKEIAIKAKCTGDLKFVKERGKVIIYVPIQDIDTGVAQLVE
jgi:hypothetical protein